MAKGTLPCRGLGSCYFKLKTQDKVSIQGADLTARLSAGQQAQRSMKSRKAIPYQTPGSGSKRSAIVETHRQELRLCELRIVLAMLTELEGGEAM
jgi:hypothetical protein